MKLATLSASKDKI